MTKSKLISLLAKRLGLPKNRAEEAVNSIFDLMGQSLEIEKRIEIRGFGSFSLKHHNAYLGRNPKTGDPVDVKPKQTIHFKVGKQLRNLVNRLPKEE